MERTTSFDHPLLLGFEHTRMLIERVGRTTAESYPPYNIEDRGEGRIRITLAVAGFAAEHLQVQVGDNQLTVVGRRDPEEAQGGRDYLHRGIAARGFTRGFVLADGLEVVGARLEDGLLHIDAERPPRRQARLVPIQKG
ncbi:MAG: Hsp20 family protein [Alphaproteobacteria bacterium]|nr:Hsp20 family protein [Alphaproteobacteria bacterium]